MTIINENTYSVNTGLVNGAKTFYNNFPASFTDFLERMVDTINQQSISEAQQACGCRRYSHDPERKNYLNGFRTRRINFPVFGTLEIKEARTRKSSAFSGIVQTLVQAEREFRDCLCRLLYLKGVSIRDIEKFLEEAGEKPIKRSRISQVIAEKTRPALVLFEQGDLSEKAFPILFVDSLYENIRVGPHVYSLACVVVYGIDSAGCPVLLALYPTLGESGSAYCEVFEQLKARGLSGPVLVISDAHAGLKEAVRLSFPGCLVQICAIHLNRACLRKLPEGLSRKEKSAFGKAISKVFDQPTRLEALESALEFIQGYQEKYPEAVDNFKEHFLDSLTFYSLPEIKPGLIRSSNLIERQNSEIRRRSGKVHVFPDRQAYQRLLVNSRLLCGKDWFNTPQVDPEGLEEVCARLGERNGRLALMGSALAEGFRSDRDTKVWPSLKSRTFFEVFLSYDSHILYEDGLGTNTGMLLAWGITTEGERVPLYLSPCLNSQEEAVEKALSELAELDFCRPALLCHNLTGVKALSLVEQQEGFISVRSRDQVMERVLSRVPENKKKKISKRLKRLFSSKDLDAFNRSLEALLPYLKRYFPLAAGILSRESEKYQELLCYLNATLSLRRCSSVKHASAILSEAIAGETRDFNYIGWATQVNGIMQRVMKTALGELDKSAYFAPGKISILDSRTFEEKTVGCSSMSVSG